MFKRALSALVAIAAPVGIAEAQTFPQVTLPSSTVLGRLPGTAGPGEAIPFSTFLNALASASNLPVIHPSSGNNQGPGCNGAQAVLLSNANDCINGDVIAWTSTDPSALFKATVGGTITAGDRTTITFTTASGSCSGGCAVSYVSVGGDTTAIVAQKLTCAIANFGVSLFNLNGGTCTAGVITAPATGGYGGYTASQFGYILASGSVIAGDFDSRVSMSAVASVTGAATETVTFTNSSCGSACSNALDNNPVLAPTRFVTGYAPAAGSQIFAIEAQSNDSASLTAITAQYGTIVWQVVSSTHGAISGKIGLITPDVNDNLAQGVWVGAGLYSVSNVDKGLDTANFSSLWVKALDQITDTASQWTFAAASAHPFVFSSTAGYGFGLAPSANDLESANSISAFGTTNPTTGAGITLDGNTTPAIFAFNWGTSAYLPLVIDALSYDFKPSNSATSGVTILANELKPDATAVTAIGDATHVWSDVYATLTHATGLPVSTGLSGAGSGVLTALGVAASGSGSLVLGTSPTITTPNEVGTVAVGNAAAGSIGEYVSQFVLVGSSVALTTGVSANVTSISLTAGDWDVNGNISLAPGGTTTTQSALGGFSLTSATLQVVSANGFGSSVGAGASAGVPYSLSPGTTRVNVSSTTTVYLVVNATFSVSTNAAYGFISARRVR